MVKDARLKRVNNLKYNLQKKSNIQAHLQLHKADKTGSHQNAGNGIKGVQLRKEEMRLSLYEKVMLSIRKLQGVSPQM